MKKVKLANFVVKERTYNPVKTILVSITGVKLNCFIVYT